MNTPLDLASACLTLGKAGVHIALHSGSLAFKLPATNSNLRTLLLRHRVSLEECLEGRSFWSPDAADIFTERLAVADGLEMPTHPGSPAWLVAVGEALAHDPSWAVPADPFTKAAADAGVPPCGQALVAHALRLFPGSSVAHVQRLRPGQSAKEFL